LGVAWKRHAQIAELRRENAELRQSADEMERLGAEISERDAVAIDTNELKRLRELKPELMRMRSEIGQLRQLAKVELPAIRKEAEHAATQAAHFDRRAEDLGTQRAAKLHSALVRDFLDFSILRPLMTVAEFNGGQFPSRFAEVEPVLKHVPPDRGARWIGQALSQTNELNPREVEIIGRSFSVSARDFEFVSPARLRMTSLPPTLLLRELNPRPLPDGRFARWYGFTDGRVEEALSTDGNFLPWERERSR
jgi:hypothetical protein